MGEKGGLRLQKWKLSQMIEHYADNYNVNNKIVFLLYLHNL